MQQPRRHEFPRQRVGSRLQCRDEELVRLAQTSQKRDHQVVLADRSAHRIELFRQRLDLVDVLQHTITFVHHGREETSTKEELVGQTLLLEVSLMEGMDLGHEACMRRREGRRRRWDRSEDT
ncbi:hypothetical protein PC123_g29100 [Phytophthora cactorum]|nr:hypothetical protein PC123_g29100 [Phytophthora cactorum]